jgi:hypothetical protein
MRAFAIVAVTVLGLCLTGPAKAANLNVGPWNGARSYVGPYYDDGPYYITPRGDSFYIDCGRPRVPYPEDAYGPNPNSKFFGPVGYRCVRGTYAMDPFYPPRCRTAFIKTSRGWARARRCF